MRGLPQIIATLYYMRVRIRVPKESMPPELGSKLGLEKRVGKFSTGLLIFRLKFRSAFSHGRPFQQLLSSCLPY